MCNTIITLKRRILLSKSCNVDHRVANVKAPAISWNQLVCVFTSKLLWPTPNVNVIALTFKNEGTDRGTFSG